MTFSANLIPFGNNKDFYDYKYIYFSIILFPSLITLPGRNNKLVKLMLVMFKAAGTID